MKLRDLRILPTNETPEIILQPGRILIKGRSMKTIEPACVLRIEEWVNTYIAVPAEITTVDVYFEYLNTGNLAYYSNLLRKLVSINSENIKIIINWYTEEGDDDMVEKGEYLSELLNIQFVFETISE